MIEKIDWPTLGMTVDETTVVLRVDRRSVIKSMKEDGLPWRKVGRSYRISHNALEAWLARGGMEKLSEANDLVGTEDDKSPRDEF